MRAAAAGEVEQAAFLEALVERSLPTETGARGLYGRGETFEEIVAAVDAIALAEGRLDGATAIRFPPVISRRDLERSGYLEQLSAPRRNRLRLRRRRGGCCEPRSQGSEARGLERVPGDGRRRAHPGNVLSRVPVGGRPRSSPRGRATRRRRRVLLPARAVRRSGTDAVVPHARERADRGACARQGVARRMGRRGVSRSWNRWVSTPPSFLPMIRSSGVVDGCSPRDNATRN